MSGINGTDFSGVGAYAGAACGCVHFATFLSAYWPSLTQTPGPQLSYCPDRTPPDATTEHATTGDASAWSSHPDLDRTGSSGQSPR